MRRKDERKEHYSVPLMENIEMESCNWYYKGKQITPEDIMFKPIIQSIIECFENTMELRKEDLEYNNNISNETKYYIKGVQFAIKTIKERIKNAKI